MSKLLNKLFGWKYVLYPVEQFGERFLAAARVKTLPNGTEYVHKWSQRQVLIPEEEGIVWWRMYE